RVAIDIRSISDFGVGTYVRNVVREIGYLDQVNEYVLIGQASRIFNPSQLPPNLRTVNLELPAGSAKGYLALRRILSEEHCDVFHMPSLFWLPPYLPPCPYVVTIHDVVDYMYRTTSHRGMRGALHFYSTRHVLRHAARIMAVSNFTRQ